MADRKRPGAETTIIGRDRNSNENVYFAIFLTAFIFLLVATVLWKNGILVFYGGICG